MDNEIVLYINLLWWVVSLFIYYRKRGRTLGWYIMLLYTLISFFAIPLYMSPYSNGFFSEKLTLYPFIYLWLMIFLSLMPIFMAESVKIRALVFPKERYFKILCWIVIVLSFIKLLNLITEVMDGTFMARLQADAILEAYGESTASRMERKSFSGNVDIIGVLTNISTSISPLLFFLSLIYPIKNKMIICGLGLSLLVLPMEGMIQASRALLIVNIVLCFYFFLFVKSFMSYEIKKRIFRFALIIVSFVSFIFVIISVSRMGTNDIRKIFWGYERYFAESVLVFDSYCMNANGTREGNITIPLFKAMFGEDVLSETEMRSKYNYMRIDNSRFSTFVGDFVLDFGAFVAFIIFVLFSLSFALLLYPRKSTMSLEQIILLYLVMRFNLGFYQYLYSTVSGNILFVSLLMMFFYFKGQKKYYKLRLV